MSTWEAVGWVGSSLLVLSLLQTNIVRLRVLNFVGCVVAATYNLVLGVWPSVALNIALTAINLVQLGRLRRSSRPEATKIPRSAGKSRPPT